MSYKITITKKLRVMGVSLSWLMAMMLGSSTALGQASITLTGPGSVNLITWLQAQNSLQQNINNVGVANNNAQVAVSGPANVSGNTIGGSALSGNAWNGNNTGTGVSIANGGSVCCFNFGSGLGSASIFLTGPGSFNSISGTSVNNTTVVNANNVGVNNQNAQTAVTGGANVSGNTIGGSAVSGPASNSNSTGTGVTISNGGGGTAVVPVAVPLSASIGVTGPGSTNIIGSTTTNTYTQTTTNNVGVSNTNNQTAVSGPANVSGNTIGGSAVSGSASNSNTASTGVSITN